MNAAPETRLSWLLDRFADETPGVRHAQTVSADGMHLAGSGDLEQTDADTFAAVASGLASLCDSAADVFGLEPVIRHVVEAAEGWILITRISSRASLAVVTDRDADLGLVGYEMTLLTERAGEVLSPDLIDALKNPLDV